MLPNDALTPVRHVVERLVAEGQAPGFVVAVARGDDPPAHVVVGADAAGAPLAVDTPFPVASITKLATDLAVLRLADAGALAPEDPLARHLPEAAAARDGATLRHLLCHTAGLPTEYPQDLAPLTPDLDWPAMARACLATPSARAAGEKVEYSNVGYNLLGIVVERLTGQAFPDALAALVLDPLGVAGTIGVAPPRPTARIAGVPGPHAGTDLDMYNSRFGLALGRPNGGLVTTAAGALALVRAFLGYPADFLRPETRAAATRDQTGGMPGLGLVPRDRYPWGLGPSLRQEAPPHFHAPPAASPRAFGMGGASGGVAWADPDADLAAAVLAPRFIGPWLSEAIAVTGAAMLAGDRA